LYLNVRALVLSARRSGEKDKRLVLYTREEGRLSALAVGAARPGAKLGPATETAVESSFRLWRGSSAPGTVPGARITGGGVENAFPVLRQRWDRMSAAQVLCEWTERLTLAAEPHPEKYDLLRRALAALETEDVDAVRLAFQIQFLILAGYSPSRDVAGLSGVEGVGALFEALAAYGFAGGAPRLPAALPAPYFQQQLLKFVAPLLAKPLRSTAHEENLRAYQSTSR
jgi:DNA repair protein RecO (recombination protein O)